MKIYKSPAGLCIWIKRFHLFIGIGRFMNNRWQEKRIIIQTIK